MRFFFESKLLILLLSIILIASFTAINNYFFYSYTELDANRKNHEVFSLINAAYSNCAKSQSLDCSDKIIKIVSDARIRGSVEISIDGKSVYSSSTQRFNLDRKSVTLKENITEDISITLSILTTPPLWQSTLRSMTFSVLEWPHVISSDQDFKGFFTYVALPRSAPAISAMIATATFVWILMIHTKAAMLRRIETTLTLYDNTKEKEELERKLNLAISQHNEISKNLEIQLETHHKLLRKVEQKETEIELLRKQSNNSQHEHEREMLDLYKERDELESEAYKLIAVIDDFKNKENNLIKENEDLKLKIQENNKNRSVIKSKKFLKLNSEQKLLAKYLLLEAPDVERCKEFDSKHGKHHSKDYIEDLSKSLRSNDDISEIIESVVSHAYNSKKQGRVELCREVDDSFYLVVYFHNSDEGFSAKIKLSGKNLWQSMAQAKFILAASSRFEGYTLIDKT